MPDIDPALQDTAVRELRAIMADFRERFSHPNGPAQEDIFRQWEKLLWLLGLAPRERAFVNALLDDASDFTTAEIYADYLEEEGRAADGARLRRLVPRDGDVLVWRVPYPDPPDDGPVGAQDDRWSQAARSLSDFLRPRGITVTWVVLPDDAALDALPPDVLRAAGWVRTADVRGALRALEEEVESAAGGSVDPGYLVRRFACDRFPVPAPEAPPP